jgi:hypothetical protein
MYGSMHIHHAAARRRSVAGVVLWLGLSAALATAVGVGVWTAAHHGGGGANSPADVRRLQAEAYTRGLAAGSVRASGGRAGAVRTATVRRKSYELGYAAGYRAGRRAAH